MLYRRKYLLFTFDLDLGRTNRYPLPPTSCDLCICKLWSYCVQRFMRCIYKKKALLDFGAKVIETLPSIGYRIIYKNIHYLTLDLGSRSQETLPCTLFIIRSMHLQSLNLLCPTSLGDAFTRKYIISSPEPKVHGWANSIPVTPASVRPSSVINIST